MYDQARHAWVTDTVPSSTFDLRSVDGVVSWTGANTVFLRTYDSSLGLWQKDDNALGSPFDLASTNGVVAWSNGNIVRARIYDPLRRQWVRDDTVASGTISLLNDSGLVAWSNGSVLYGRLYHPLKGQWLATVVTPASRTAILIGITNATAAWSDGFGTGQIGYNFGATNWQAGPTTPLAAFAVSTNAGAAPLAVHFTDLSVAGTGRAWTFGDTGASALRSPLHTFRNPGRFTVTQTVTGTSGTVSAVTNILTDIEPPAGMVVINGDATFTTNHLVTLTLGAADNSGTVALMRFSNDGTTWAAWQPYATNAAWELLPGVTTRTVHAQFQDPFGNISAPVKDLIFLDTTPPPPVRFAVLETNVVEGAVNLSLAVNLGYPMGREVRVDYVTEEITATAGTDFETTTGTLIFGTGTTNRSVTVRLFEDNAVELDEHFRVVLTNGLDTVPGPPVTVGILDDDPAAVQFTAGRFSAGEGDGNGVLSLVLSAPSGRAVSVAFTATNGTATAGLDYVALTGVVEFAPGQTAKTITVPLLDDALDEFTETIEVRLLNPTNAVLTAPSTAILDLLDNEPPTVNFSAPNYTAGESAGSFIVNVGLTKSYAQAIFVDYATTGGTATPGQDFVAANGTLIFSPGQTNRTFQVSLLSDPVGEPPETVELRLSGFVNVLPGERTQATLTLLDDDALTLAVLGYSATEGFRLGITGPAGGRVRVELSTDLEGWGLVATLDNPDGAVEFTDSTLAGPTGRYYRARSVP